MAYEKSREAANKASHKADRLYETSERAGSSGRSGSSQYHQDQAHRYSLASEYLEKRADRDRYGSGHNMSIHGEGKPYGKK